MGEDGRRCFDIECVLREEFDVEMCKIFGDPIGSSAASKVLSDERCDACFEYLVTLEAKEQAYGEYKMSNERLNWSEDGGSIQGENRAMSAGSSDQKKDDILVRAAAYDQYTAMIETLKQNDDKRDDRGVKIHGRWGRYIKDAVGRGRNRRLFLQKQPAPDGVAPRYCLVASKGSLGATILEVVKPSRWYEVLRAVHAQKNHAGRDKIFAAVKERYWNVPKFAIDRFSKLCQARQQKSLHASTARNGSPATTSVRTEKPLKSNVFLDRLSISIFVPLNSPPKATYKMVLCIKDVSTQFIQLGAMRKKRGEEAASYILEFLFRFGGTHILHSLNGNDFNTAMMDSLARKWDYPLVLGQELPPEGGRGPSAELASSSSSSTWSQSVLLAKEFLDQWFSDPSRTVEQKLHWEQQLEKIAYSVNCMENKEKGKSPHECVFGQKPKMGPILPGITHALVRDTFRRSFLREEDLGMDELDKILSFTPNPAFSILK